MTDLDKPTVLPWSTFASVLGIRVQVNPTQDRGTIRLLDTLDVASSLPSLPTSSLPTSSSSLPTPSSSSSLPSSSSSSHSSVTSVWLGIEWDSSTRGKQHQGRFRLPGSSDEIDLFQCQFADSSASLLRVSLSDIHLDTSSAASSSASSSPSCSVVRTLVNQLGERRSLLDAIRYRYCDESAPQERCPSSVHARGSDSAELDPEVQDPQMHPIKAAEQLSESTLSQPVDLTSQVGE